MKSPPDDGPHELFGFQLFLGSHIHYGLHSRFGSQLLSGFQILFGNYYIT